MWALKPNIKHIQVSFQVIFHGLSESRGRGIEGSLALGKHKKALRFSRQPEESAVWRKKKELKLSDLSRPAKLTI